MPDIFKIIKSIQALPKKTLNHTEKNLLIAIVIRLGENNFIWANNLSIGKWIGEDGTYIKVLLSHLKKKKYLEIDGRGSNRKIKLGLKLIENNFLGIPYKDYLKTEYWKTVRKKILNKYKHKCTICNSKTNLNVHHKTYDHIGEELNYLEDLILLCENCHSIYHSKLKEEN